jgi:hypothetical protein
MSGLDGNAIAGQLDVVVTIRGMTCVDLGALAMLEVSP